MDGPTASAVEGVTRGFLFADLRGYSQLVEARGAVEAKHALERYQALTRDVVSRRGGAEIRTEGDSFYVVLPSASAAVRCGLDLIAASLAPPDGGDPISVGVGIHAGETVPYGGDYVGTAVNIAARICAVARPNELLASGTVRELTRSVVSARFVPVGRRALKGIAGTVEIFRVVPDAMESGASTAAPILTGARDRRVLTAAGVVLVALAIGAVAILAQAVAPGARPSASTNASPALSFSASSTQSPGSASALASAPAATLPLRDAGSQDSPPPVSPNTYAPNLNQDVASFTISEPGWRLLADQADVLALELGAPQTVSGSLGVSRISVAFNGACERDRPVLIGRNPEDLIRWATSNPHLQVSSPTVALELGLPGIAVDATVLALPAGHCPEGNPERIRLWQQGGLNVALLAGSRIRLEALDSGDETLAIAVISEDQADFPAFVPHAQGLLDQMILRRA